MRRDLTGTESLGAFEEHVFEEVSDTDLIGVFVDDACADNDMHRAQRNLSSLLNEKSNSIGEDGAIQADSPNSN